MWLKVGATLDCLVEVFHSDFKEYSQNGLSDKQNSIFLAQCKPVNWDTVMIDMAQNRNSSKMFSESLLNETAKILLTV
jgi:hypothetical protein